MLRISRLLRSLGFAHLVGYNIATSVYGAGAEERNHTRLCSVRVIYLAQPFARVPTLGGFSGPGIPIPHLRLAHVLRHTQHIE